MKKTVAILFNGGSYGTYLEWCLTTLTSADPVREPFTSSGTSHKFKGNHLHDINGWKQYLTSNIEHPFVRLHPKIKSTESLTANLLKVAEDADRIVYIYPDKILLGINNFFFKIWPSWIDQSFKTFIDPDKLYKNWPVSNDTPLDQIPRWVMREFLSFHLIPTWLDQVEWGHQTPQHHPNSLTITVSELLFDFEITLTKIQRFCNLDFCQPISTLASAHKTNLNLQQYIDHDTICYSIIDSIILKKDLEWSTLSLPSEAWIQWELRNQGFEIQCHGLDMFPTNSIQLRELLYPV